MKKWAHSIRAVAFDMDGLIVNTEELYTVVCDTILDRRGRKFTPHLKRQMMGLPGPAAWQMLIDHEGLSDSIATLAHESDQLFSNLLRTDLRTLPGLGELLEHLDELRLPRCIATSSSHEFARRVLETVGLIDRFDFVVTAEDVAHGKPAPDIYRAAARRMGVAPEQMMVLEDSQHGATAGVAAGAFTVAVPGEHSADHDFSSVQLKANTLADQVILAALGVNMQQGGIT
ncbi:MAG: HAD family phosphatase [Planctomycetales bacterium]|nr:HAD family phosphatase [Planctomycetales bacterium]